MKYTDEELQNLIESAGDIISDFDRYGEVLQTDSLGIYGPDSAIKRLRKSLDELEG